MELVTAEGIPDRRGIKQRLKSALQLLPLRLYRSILFVKAHHRLPKQNPPRTFSEKINWRIINDRGPRISLACDKLATKHDISQRFAWINLPPTLWEGTDLDELRAIELPDRWVLKPNHAAAMVCFGTGPVDAKGLARLKAATSDWLALDLGRDKGEVAHDSARRTFLVEPFLGEGPNPPEDYKGFVFHGRVAFWRVSLDRFGEHAISFIDPDGNPMEIGLKNYPLTKDPSKHSLQVPRQLEEMNEIAEALAHGFDFIRVDLYVVGDQVIFGELTPFPDSGLEPYEPRDADRWLGDLWSLPAFDPGGQPEVGLGSG